MTDQQHDGGRQFASGAGEARPGLVREFVDFLKNNKKWWLAPIVILIVLFGLLVLLSGTAAGPFIYTLF
jgi:hypothetical protein